MNEARLKLGLSGSEAYTPASYPQPAASEPGEVLKFSF